MTQDNTMIQWYCMANYVTTNIRFYEDDYLRLKEEAARKRSSLSALVREKIGVKRKRDSKQVRLKKLLSLDTSWFTEKDYQDYLKSRKQLKRRAKLYNW